MYMKFMLWNPYYESIARGSLNLLEFVWGSLSLWAGFLKFTKIANSVKLIELDELLSI